MALSHYPATRKALSIVDTHIAQIEALWDRSWTDEEIEFCTHVDFMREDYVRQAFLVDTAAATARSRTAR